MAGRNSVRAYRAAATRALAAELGHDIQGGIGLFRLLTERASQGQPLDNDEIQALGEELERLSDLAARLRGFARIPLERREHTPREVVDAACMLATPLARPLPLEIELEGDLNARLNCDINVLAQGLAELIDNALEAKTQRAGVRVRADRNLAFCVWDDGPGFEHGVKQALHWGASTRAGALGLGLTLALRSARAHGFSLELAREQERTLATLLVPARDVLSERDKLDP